MSEVFARVVPSQVMPTLRPVVHKTSSASAAVDLAKMCAAVQAVRAAADRPDASVLEVLLQNPCSSAAVVAGKVVPKVMHSQDVERALGRLVKLQLVKVVSSGPNRYRVPEVLQQELDRGKAGNHTAKSVAKTAPSAPSSTAAGGERKQTTEAGGKGKPFSAAQTARFLEKRQENERAVLRFLVGRKEASTQIGTFFTSAQIAEGVGLSVNIVEGVLFNNRTNATVHKITPAVSVIVTSDRDRSAPVAASGEKQPQRPNLVWGAMRFQGDAGEIATAKNPPAASADGPVAPSVPIRLKQSASAAGPAEKKPRDQKINKPQRQHKGGHVD